MKSSRIFNLFVAGISVLSLSIAGDSIRQAAIAESSKEQLLETAQSANVDVQTLVNLGPRVSGTTARDEAIAYLRQEYQKAGYVTEIRPFTYSKLVDRGSGLFFGGTEIAGRALNGSPDGNVSAPLVAVPHLGRREDFAQVDVQGKIALVRRGEIRFLEKANNAVAAGAVGLVIVNNTEGNFFGTLGGETSIPVLSLAPEQGTPLLEGTQSLAEATLKVDTDRVTVNGQNLIAHGEGVTQPQLLLGAHYDSVSGSPGANDNASGTAVVLNIARQLAGTQQAREVWFVAFDGEEDGLHGSRAFVEAAAPQFLSQLQGMLNFDMVGINKELLISGSSALADVVQSDRVSPLGSAAGSDHVPFAGVDVPVLFFTRGLEPAYHSPQDAQVDPNLLQETVEVGLEVTKQILE